MLFERLGHIIGVFFRLMHVLLQQMYGAWRISALKPPVVTIFGSGQLKEDNVYWKKANRLAHMLVDANISVLTGGGPGIMQAASCGAVPAQSTKGVSIGIGVRDVGEGPNPCVHKYFELKYFFARKWLLTRYSSAFIVFPGGFGTLDELAEILTLLKTKHLRSVPVILIGKEFWDPFIVWLKTEGVQNAMIAPEHLTLFMVTDELDEAFCMIRDECAFASFRKGNQ